jgi:hypothetical protein
MNWRTRQEGREDMIPYAVRMLRETEKAWQVEVAEVSLPLWVPKSAVSIDADTLRAMRAGEPVRLLLAGSRGEWFRNSADYTTWCAVVRDYLASSGKDKPKIPDWLRPQAWTLRAQDLQDL